MRLTLQPRLVVMSQQQASPRTWILIAGISGLAGVLFYFGAAFLPVPDTISRLLAFAFGPALVISFLGMFHVLSVHRSGPVVQIACLLGVIAGTMVTAMLVVQIGNNMVRAEMLGSAESESAKDSIMLAWRAVNRVQYLLDVVWDLFICGAVMMLGVALFSHPRFGKVWGGSGFAVGFALLYHNLRTFPYGPGETGSVDVGPLVALWMMAVFVRMLFIRCPDAQVPAP